MRNTIIGLLVAASGVVVAKAGQGIMTTEWDALWAGVAIASVLSGCTIPLYATIRRWLIQAIPETGQAA